MRTVYALESAPLHVYGDHPERPARLEIVAPRLASLGAEALKFGPATREQIGRVHSAAMIRFVEEACKRGDSVIDLAPTYVTRSSFEDASLAAGATLECTRLVLRGEAENGFAIVRPPGHHAEPDRTMGFCIFNNIAIAACEALAERTRRVAIVDFDAHHGNGTQAAFLDDERVAYLSTHQWGIYPGTGWYEDAPAARKRIVNVPLPAGAGNRCFASIAEELIAPFIRGFSPDLLLVSAGFDAHWSDPLTALGVSSIGFHAVSARLVELASEFCDGRIVFVLEGGYDPVNIANGVEAVFSALLGIEWKPRPDLPPGAEPDVHEHLEAIKTWHGF